MPLLRHWGPQCLTWEFHPLSYQMSLSTHSSPLRVAGQKWVCVMGSQIYTILLLRWQLPLLTSCVYEEVQICKLLKREDKCRQLKWHCARLLRLPIKWLVTWSQELPGQWWCFRKDESTWISLQKLQMAGAMEALHNVMSIGIVTLWNNRKFSLLSPTLNGRETRRSQYDYK